jgi:hypothetical protein
MRSERLIHDAAARSQKEFAEREARLKQAARDLWRECPGGPHSPDWQKFKALQAEFDRLAYDRAAVLEEARIAAASGRPPGAAANHVM